MVAEMIRSEPVVRLTRDLRANAATMSTAEARFVVDLYYSVQDYRIAAANQVRALTEDGEPVAFLDWTFSTMRTVEEEAKQWLDVYSTASPAGVWSRSIVGIGPVIAAGLLAHIDITRAPTVGHIWSFAGLNPTATWGKGEKRPWNARLKVLAWKLGESFVKVSGHEQDVYGHLYAERKQYEIERNERGELAEQAAGALKAKRIGEDTGARKHYEAGRLPPAHIHARAKRWAVKLLLADWHHVAYEAHYGTLPPKPYVIEHLGHVHVRPVPNHTCIGG